MARRTAPKDPSIGDRIKARRELHGWSIRHAASRAGIAHTTWSRIEAGTLGTDNRFILAQVAEALECSLVDLAQTIPPTDTDSVAAQLSIGAIRQALVETDLDEPSATEPRPLDLIELDVDLATRLKLKCDYAGAGRMLPRLLRELHALSLGPDNARALLLLVRAATESAAVIRNIGYPAEAWLASERAHQAAVLLGDPVMLGMAAWSRGHSAASCGAYDRSLRVAETAIPTLERVYDLPGAPELLGQLHLLAGFSLLGQGRREETGARLDAADEIATRTGDTTTLGLMFGPTNIKIWRISMEVDGGDPSRALEIARSTRPDAVPAPNRQVTYFFDTGRALAQVGRHDDAVRMLINAERAAPQRMHTWGTARETVRMMLGQNVGRRASAPLRGLAERMGIHAD